MKRFGAGLLLGGITSLALLAFGAPRSAADASQHQPQAVRHPVIVIGIGGLRWSDISATTTPASWQLAETGSVGALVTTTVHTTTCPDDAWLTLNAGSRAAASPASSKCRPVAVAVLPGPTSIGSAAIPAMGADRAGEQIHRLPASLGDAFGLGFRGSPGPPVGQRAPS